MTWHHEPNERPTYPNPRQSYTDSDGRFWYDNGFGQYVTDDYHADDFSFDDY